MLRSGRWVWLARLAFLGAPLVFFFTPVLGGLILATLLAPGLVHYLIREDQAAVKPRKPLVARGPLHDLALVFVGSPLVWVVLGLGGIPTSYDPAWTLSGLWMGFQCAPAASLLFLGRAELFPNRGNTPKPLILALPWLGFLSVFGYGLVFGYQGWGAILDQRFWLCLAMTVAIWILCIRLVAASRGMSSGQTILSLIKKGSAWYRRGVGAFIAAPVVWMLLWMSLCVHASLHGETPGLVDPPSSSNLESDSPPEGPSPLARSEPLGGAQAVSLMIHRAVVDDVGLVIGFTLPLLVVWVFTPVQMLPRGPKKVTWTLGLLASWGVVLVLLLVDPWGWLGWYFR